MVAKAGSTVMREILVHNIRDDGCSIEMETLISTSMHMASSGKLVDIQRLLELVEDMR